MAPRKKTVKNVREEPRDPPDNSDDTTQNMKDEEAEGEAQTSKIKSKRQKLEVSIVPVNELSATKQKLTEALTRLKSKQDELKGEEKHRVIYFLEEERREFLDKCIREFLDSLDRLKRMNKSRLDRLDQAEEMKREHLDRLDEVEEMGRELLLNDGMTLSKEIFLYVRGKKRDGLKDIYTKVEALKACQLDPSLESKRELMDKALARLKAEQDKLKEEEKDLIRALALVDEQKRKHKEMEDNQIELHKIQKHLKI